MSTPKKPTELRREEIVAAVLGIVERDGLAKLSVGSVARRIGLVPSALYRHFRNKEEMIRVTLETIGRRLETNVEAVISTRTGALEQLKSLLDRHLAMIRQESGIPKLVFSEEVFGGSGPRRALMHALLAGYLRRVAGIVSEGQQRGELRADVDAESAAVLFVGLIQPLAILWHVSGGRVDVTRIAERNWALFAEMLAAGGQPRAAGQAAPAHGKRQAPRRRGGES